MLVNILLGIGAVCMAVVGAWVIVQAITPIDGVNEPGLYRKLKDKEGKRK